MSVCVLLCTVNSRCFIFGIDLLLIVQLRNVTVQTDNVQNPTCSSCSVNAASGRTSSQHLIQFP